MRLRAKIDGNQPEIVQAGRQVGASIRSLATIGAGMPDLLVGFRGVTYLVEIKRPAEHLTSDEREFFATWRRSAPQIAYCSEDLLRIIGTLRARVMYFEDIDDEADKAIGFPPWAPGPPPWAQKYGFVPRKEIWRVQYDNGRVALLLSWAEQTALPFSAHAAAKVLGLVHNYCWKSLQSAVAAGLLVHPQGESRLYQWREGALNPYRQEAPDT